jgi:tetratricopeptide (TPR) repeat protein
MDQEGAEVAQGAYNLADVILQQNGDLIKAEELAREALRIRTLIFDSYDHNIDTSGDLLARILRMQNKLGDETKCLYEQSLAISIRNQGPDGLDTSIGHLNIGKFYSQLALEQPTRQLKQTQLLLAKAHFEESFRINAKIYGPTHPDTVAATSRLAAIISLLL